MSWKFFIAEYLRSINWLFYRKVRLQKAKSLTRKGLRVLRGHNISELEATGLNVTVNDLILSLGDWSLQNLKSLNVSRCSFLELDSTK